MIHLRSLGMRHNRVERELADIALDLDLELLAEFEFLVECGCPVELYLSFYISASSCNGGCLLSKETLMDSCEERLECLHA